MSKETDKDEDKQITPTSNYVSYSLTMLEVAILSGVVWGFSFMQFIWEQEYLFYSDTCADDCQLRCQTDLPEHLCKLTLEVIVVLYDCSSGGMSK